jgi:hypothetical protein
MSIAILHFKSQQNVWNSLTLASKSSTPTWRKTMINPGTGEIPPTRSPFTPLHPTLKACKCGFIGTKRNLYKHFDSQYGKFGNDLMRLQSDFFIYHGEVPLNEDDPRIIEHLLK